VVDGIGNSGGLAKAAIEAALKRMNSIAGPAGNLGNVAGKADVAGLDAPAGKADFSKSLLEGVREVDQSLRAADELPRKILEGGLGDFHEVAATLKQSELSFKFALEVRNKLIDAYREVMRMSV
jgi:flagellar hook-basal body complex protein FliE